MLFRRSMHRLYDALTAGSSVAWITEEMEALRIQAVTLADKLIAGDAIAAPIALVLITPGARLTCFVVGAVSLGVFTFDAPLARMCGRLCLAYGMCAFVF